MDEQSPQQSMQEQGPASIKAHDFARFDELMRALSKWRDQDHEDAVWLARTDVVELVEGVKQLRGVF